MKTIIYIYIFQEKMFLQICAY